MSILTRIVDYKIKEILALKNEFGPLDQLKLQFPNAYSLIDKIKQNRKISVISEIKRGSPSKGLFAPNMDSIKKAQYYELNGASCISVLTDRKFFYGSYKILSEIRQVSNLPILCKDFIISKYQIELAKLHGANVVLLIKRILKYEDFLELLNYTNDLNMEVLVEVDSLDEFLSIADLPFKLCGVNNRDLSDFTVSLNKTKQMAKIIKSYDKYLISESGIHEKSQVLDLRSHHIDGILVGESLIKDDNLGLINDFQVLKKPLEIKICGIQTPDDINYLNNQKVDYIGLVFAKSKRQISLNQARLLSDCNKNSKLVGVFMHQPTEYIERAFRQCSLDFVQIHGDLDFEELNIPKDRIIRALSYHDLDHQSFSRILIDSDQPGSGKTYKIPSFTQNEDIIYYLAGGLNSSNLELRINEFPCTVVDVSSGVERNNKKSQQLMKEFIQKVRTI